MTLVPSPKSRDLLPPLLACLATAFASPQPPPALLPLLAPILRQRVSFLSSSTTDGWLPLLSWDTARGVKLPKAVECMNLEPHPVSGELELEDVRPAKYRRLDQETLQARLEVEQFDLLPIYVWCENDEHASSGAGWRLAELRTLEDIEDGTEWFESATEASEAAGSGSAPAAHANDHATVTIDAAGGDDDDNDDYWAAYDRTPGETPARTPAKRSPAPFAARSTANREEDDYYARYGEEVQPAMDSHDPDEDYGEVGQSTLNGHALAGVPAPAPAPARTDSADYYASLQPHKEWHQPNDSAIATATERSPEQTNEHRLSMPRPISPASSHSSVGQLEEKAAEMSSGNSDQAQLAVKQHISTDVKSLYRLAKASGMTRADFEGVVRRELEVLGMFDDE